jgi:phosphatidylinositol phospholipase C delta
MTVYGMPVDSAHKYTKAIVNSGRLVVEQDFEFSVRYPEMAVLCLELMDEDAGARAGCRR